jgi:hypothetical protein
MHCGNLVGASGLPGQSPPTAKLRKMKKRWLKTPSKAERLLKEIGHEDTQSTRSLKFVPLRKIQCTFEGAFFVVDFLLQLEDGVEDGFGPRGAARDVHIDGNHLVATLHDGVIIEDAA